MALAALTCVVMLLVLFAVGKGLLKEITHNSTVIGKKQTADKQLKKNIEALPGLSQAYQNLGSTKDLIAVALPSSSSFPELVAMMEAVASTNNVTLNSVSPASDGTSAFGASGSTTSGVSTPAAATPTPTATGSGTPSSYPFSVNVKGKYADITKFLGSLQLSARPIKITDVQLTGTTDTLSGTITAETFYYSPVVLQDKTETVQ